MKDELGKIRMQLWDLKNQLARVPEGVFSVRQIASNITIKLLDVLHRLDDLIENGKLPEPAVKKPKPEAEKVEPQKETKAKKKPIYEVLGGNHGDR